MLINNSTQVFTKELAAISRLETKCVYDKFEMLVTDSHQYKLRAPTIRHQDLNCVANITVRVRPTCV